jgi:PAS domain S-box-containing protein
MSSTNDAVITQALDGTITSWNRAAEKVFGYQAEEMVGKPIFQLVPSDLHTEERRLLSRIQAGEKVERFETRRLKKNGGIVSLSMVISPIGDETSGVIGLCVIGRDLTPERLAQNAQPLLAAIIDASDDAIISKDLNGIITSWNKAAARIFGYDANEVIGRSILTIIPPELHSDEMLILERLRNGEKIEHFETNRLRKDGTRVAISLTVYPIRNDKGVVVGASKVARDISSQREAEIATRHLAAIVDSSDDAIISKDLNGIITSWNPAAARLFGYTAEEAIGKPITILMRTNEAAEEPSILARIARGEKIEHHETTRVRKNGELIQVSLTISAIRDASGKVTGASKIARDITERKQIESDLNQSRKQLAAYAETLEQRVAERTERLQETIGELEAFSYSVSHDMRTPLRAMQGYSERLLTVYRDKLGEEGQHHLERIAKNANQLQLLVRDILTYSKVAKDQVDLTPIDLDQFLQNLIQTNPELSRDTATLKIRHPLPRAMAHEAYLSQVFTNLIGNALKFVVAGRNTIVEIWGEKQDGVLVVHVKDNGIGIAPEHYNRIFEIFGRVHPDSKFEGTGIGLSIVRKAVQRMGGQVSVESKLDEGSCFSFTLKAA